MSVSANKGATAKKGVVTAYASQNNTMFTAQAFGRSLLFVGLFVPIAAAVMFADGFVWKFMENEILSFFVTASMIVPFCKTKNDWIFLAITYLHGLAHIMHPAFHGLVPNEDYTPLWDFFVHAIQCVSVYYYSRNLLPIGIILSNMCMVNAICGHMNRMFMANHMWLIFSAAGVIGTHYTTMLANNKRDAGIFIGGVIIWGIAYSGYLDFTYLAEWDLLLNQLGLYRLWYIAFFWTIQMYHKFF